MQKTRTSSGNDLHVSASNKRRHKQCPRHVALVCLTLLITYWFAALIYAALTLEEMQSGSQHEHQHDSNTSQHISSKTLQLIAARGDDIALEIPGIEIRIHAPTAKEDPIQVVYTNYAAASLIGPSKGLVLLLHACSHSAFKFFSPSSACPNCVGLSEELRIARLIIEQGYTPVAVSSANRGNGCWSTAVDVPRIKAVLLHALFRKYQPAEYDVFGIGASSGGAFAAELAARKLVQGALVMVMQLPEDVVNKLRSAPQPIYLAPMPRDRNRLTNVVENYHNLEKEFTILDVTTCGSRPVTTTYLLQRVPGMTAAAADALVAMLARAGHLDAASHLMLVDPTLSDWRTIVSPGNATHWLGKFKLAPGYSPVAKALHRAWAFHEYCAEVVVPALQFFEHALH